MKLFKRVVVAMVAALACAGVYVALRNLPVASGCSFYANCPDAAEIDPAPTTSRAATPVGAVAETSAP